MARITSRKSKSQWNQSIYTVKCATVLHFYATRFTAVGIIFYTLAPHAHVKPVVLVCTLKVFAHVTGLLMIIPNSLKTNFLALS